MWKIGFFGLLALLVILLNILAWYFFVRGRLGEPIPSPTPSPTSLLTPTAFMSPSPTTDETSLIKQAVFAKTGLDETKAEVTINRNTGTHAKGNIKEFEAVGGAYWLAAKTGSGWICVYDGQSHPTCAQIAPYDFPRDIVPECLDERGNVVRR